MSETLLRIEGMYCKSCARRIEHALLGVGGVFGVVVEGDVAHVSHDSATPWRSLVKAVEQSGYVARRISRSSWPQAASEKARNAASFGLLVAALALLAAVVNAISGHDVFNAIPVIDSSLSLGALFTTGVLTGLHCASMCGALNLATTAAPSFGDATRRNLFRPALYNVGRLASYTVLGAIAGALGGVVIVDTRLSSSLMVAASVVMLAMSLRMAGIVSFKVPQLTHSATITKALARIRSAMSAGGSLAVGLVNGFMPCGPLQAMQLYALATGSAARGAMAMFVFCLGTMPLMLGMGYIAGVIRGRGRAIMPRVAAALMFALALSMLTRGLSVAGISVRSAVSQATSSSSALVPTVHDGIQQVEFDLEFDSYANLQLVSGIPARVVIHADRETITGCNNEVLMPAWGIDAHITSGENVIEFVPDEPGTYTYSCWMHMIENTIEVVEDKSA